MSDMGTKGFTLIEVLIITAIIGVLTTIAVMNFGGIIDSYKARGAASHLYSDMQLARLRAVKEGKEVKVRFAVADTFYAITTIGYKKTTTLSSDYSGITMTTNIGTGIVDFNPNGTATSGTVTIAKGTRSVGVTINPSTGNIRIK